MVRPPGRAPRTWHGGIQRDRRPRGLEGEGPRGPRAARRGHRGMLRRPSRDDRHIDNRPVPPGGRDGDIRRFRAGRPEGGLRRVLLLIQGRQPRLRRVRGRLRRPHCEKDVRRVRRDAPGRGGPVHGRVRCAVTEHLRELRVRVVRLRGLGIQAGVRGGARILAQHPADRGHRGRSHNRGDGSCDHPQGRSPSTILRSVRSFLGSV